jgi:hypothetical protein
VASALTASIQVKRLVQPVTLKFRGSVRGGLCRREQRTCLGNHRAESPDDLLHPATTDRVAMVRELLNGRSTLLIALLQRCLARLLANYSAIGPDRYHRQEQLGTLFRVGTTVGFQFLE